MLCFCPASRVFQRPSFKGCYLVSEELSRVKYETSVRQLDFPWGFFIFAQESLIVYSHRGRTLSAPGLTYFHMFETTTVSRPWHIVGTQYAELPSFEGFHTA